ncbi:uncharacterized protein LOC130714278 [Lotus japonicus]|uniref:uncharacterized protein LOC130714278 n=1 Tax=Lotus japonicus TaxID=34305 RepID=UPI002583AAE2|nr:uncharacterized protein LOC130714278 [Lotus japonicus]
MLAIFGTPWASLLRASRKQMDLVGEFGAIYASPIPASRDGLWEHLAHLRNTISIPWLMIGDWNEVVQPGEVRGGEFLPVRAARFASVLDNCGMVDLGMTGGKYTWFRKRNNRIILSKRLDRGMGDAAWRLAFPEAYVEALNRVHSDHCPLLVHFNASIAVGNNRPFCFVAAWADHPEYKDVVDKAWVGGDRAIAEKLDKVRAGSCTFNKEVFGNIFRRKRWVEGRLRGVQRELNHQVTSSMTRLEAEL